MNQVAQEVINGLSLGSSYALLALGLAVLFSVVGLINFAQGELVVTGGYAMWAVGLLHLPWPVEAVAAVLCPAAMAIAMYYVVFRPVRAGGAPALLVTSLALALLLDALFALVISPLPLAVPVPNWLSAAVRVGDLFVPVLEIVTVVVTLVAVASLNLFLHRSVTGIAMRATAEDSRTVRLMGVSSERVIRTAFIISGALAGIAALLLVSQAGAISPTSGLNPLVKGFVAVVIGGVGSLEGAVLGGYLLGFTEVILQTILPPSLLPFRDAFALLILLSVLSFSPRGIIGFGRGGRTMRARA